MFSKKYLWMFLDSVMIIVGHVAMQFFFLMWPIIQKILASWPSLRLYILKNIFEQICLNSFEHLCKFWYQNNFLRMTCKNYVILGYTYFMLKKENFHNLSEV